MRIRPALVAVCMPFLALGQQEERVDPFVTVHFGFYPMELRGVSATSDGSTVIDNAFVPTDATYSTAVTDALVVAVIAQAGVDANMVMKERFRVGLRAGGGLGRHNGVKNADGLAAFGKEILAMGYYRRILGKLELTGLAGYKRVWGPLPYHFIMAGAELDFGKRLGVVLSTSLNRHTYYRLFTNGHEEPALTAREIGVSLIVRM